jgi:hypothetical protein
VCAVRRSQNKHKQVPARDGRAQQNSASVPRTTKAAETYDLASDFDLRKELELKRLHSWRFTAKGPSIPAPPTTRTGTQTGKTAVNQSPATRRLNLCGPGLGAFGPGPLPQKRRASFSRRRVASALLGPHGELFIILRDTEHYRLGVRVCFFRASGFGYY